MDRAARGRGRSAFSRDSPPNPPSPQHGDKAIIDGNGKDDSLGRSSLDRTERSSFKGHQGWSSVSRASHGEDRSWIIGRSQHIQTPQEGGAECRTAREGSIYQSFSSSCNEASALTGKDKPFNTSRAQQGRSSLKSAVQKSLKNHQESPMVDRLDVKEWPPLSADSSGKDRSHYSGRSPHSPASLECAMEFESPELAICSSGVEVSTEKSLKSGRPCNSQISPNMLMGSNSSIHHEDISREGTHRSNFGSSVSAHFGSGGRVSSNGRHQAEGTSQETQIRRYSLEKLENIPEPFDICPIKAGAPKLKGSFFAKNKEKRKELGGGNNCQILRDGMVILKKYITESDQIKIVKECRRCGIQPGGFYRPGYKDGAKLNLHMMCLGKNWDPETRLYEEERSVDGAKPPAIPNEFRKLVKDSIKASHDLIKENHSKSNPEEELPSMEPDICIVNFYTLSGKLGLHQDQDESHESLVKRLPVVSFSIGDSAVFLYGDDRDVNKANKIELESGDVLIFGGDSRHIFHGVSSIKTKTAPEFLSEEANLRSGRLNLTFRKF